MQYIYRNVKKSKYFVSKRGGQKQKGLPCSLFDAAMRSESRLCIGTPWAYKIFVIDHSAVRRRRLHTAPSILLLSIVAVCSHLTRSARRRSRQFIAAVHRHKCGGARQRCARGGNAAVKSYLYRHSFAPFYYNIPAVKGQDEHLFWLE